MFDKFIRLTDWTVNKNYGVGATTKLDRKYH